MPWTSIVTIVGILGKAKTGASSQMIREECRDMANNPSWDVDRIAGLRMAHLITQLKDDGLSETDIAEAIGCSPSLINKWPMPEDDSHPIVPKGIRDDVIAGIYRGLHVRSDYLFMAIPKGYPNRVRLKDGTTRPCRKNELDHKDFLVTNEQLEIARDKKERAAIREEVSELRETVTATAGGLDEVREDIKKILALLGADRERSAR